MSDFLPLEDIVFDGTRTGSDQFIRNVRRVALARDKHSDDAWCAAFAASCLEGPALAFHERLSDEVQNSWRRLRMALLDRFPSGPSSLSSVPPTPPAAGPSNWLTGSDIQDWRREMTSEQEPETTGPTQPSVEGRIRILDKEFFTLGYLSTTVHSDGPGHILSRDISKALRLRITKIANSDCHQLIIMNPGLKGRLLFAKFMAANPHFGSGSVNYSCFASSAKDDRKHIGPAQSEIWTICQDGTLDAFWMKDDQTRHLLEAAMDPSDNEPGLLPDFAGYNERRPGLWKRVRFVFERDL